jgi:hypothetical protein
VGGDDGGRGSAEAGVWGAVRVGGDARTWRACAHAHGTSTTRRLARGANAPLVRAPSLSARSRCRLWGTRLWRPRRRRQRGTRQ